MRARLLLIDTGNGFHQNLRHRLEQEGYHLGFARSPSEVEEKIRLQEFDVVLMDLTGLKMESLRVIKVIQSTAPFTQVITINTADQLALSIDMMKLGVFDDFLVPFEVNSLLERIKTAVDMKKAVEGPSD